MNLWHMRILQNNHAYIDAANLYRGTKSLGWELDYVRFRIWLKEQHCVTHAYIFIGYITKNDELYKKLRNARYCLIFKETVANNRYEFWHKQLSSGQVVLSRVQTTVNGNVRDITYHDTFGKPVTIKNNNERIDFEYYPDGLVKLKSSSVAKLEFSYDAGSKKVSQVKTIFINEKGKPIANRSTSFKYDPKGNLNYAENSEGQKITMTYDIKGRIQTITDQAKKVVKIDYDERYGKPVVVTRPGLGTIKVSYKPNGDIAKVDSAEGPTVASQVASTFNNLLDVIAPATQELYL